MIFRNRFGSVIFGSMKVIDRIEKIREVRDLTQGELERLAALPTNRITKWTKGTGEPSARQALRLARILRVPVEWLCDPDAPEEPPEEMPDPLSARERLLLDQARILGYEEAQRRLLAAPKRPASKITDPDEVERIREVHRRKVEDKSKDRKHDSA